MTQPKNRPDGRDNGRKVASEPKEPGSPIAESATDYVPHMDRAFKAGEKSQRAGTLEDLDRALELDPGNADLLNSKGEALRDSGLHDRALVVLSQALGHSPNNLRSHRARSAVLYDLGRYGEAASTVDHAISLGDNSPSAHFGEIKPSSLLPFVMCH